MMQTRSLLAPCFFALSMGLLKIATHFALFLGGLSRKKRSAFLSKQKKQAFLCFSEIFRENTLLFQNNFGIHRKFRKNSLAYFRNLHYYYSCAWHSHLLSARFSQMVYNNMIYYKEAIHYETETSG